MDESFDSHEAETRNYIISAIIFLGDPNEGLESFTSSGLQLGYKTSKLFNVSHQSNLHLMGNWLNTQEFVSLSAHVSLEYWDPEVARRLALTELITQLKLQGVETLNMDSRDNYGHRKQILNSLDNSTLSYLQRLDPKLNSTRFFFEDDNSDFRFAIADYVAWCTRRAVSAADHRFYEYFASRNNHFVVPGEMDRGRALPLLGNSATSIASKENEAGIP